VEDAKQDDWQKDEIITESIGSMQKIFNQPQIDGPEYFNQGLARPIFKSGY